MTTVPVCLVAKNCLIKEGIKNLLEKSGFSIAEECEDAGALGQGGSGRAAALVIALDGGHEDLAAAARTIRRERPASRFVVIGARPEMPMAQPLFSAGVDGYLQHNASCTSLVEALRRVIAGEKIYPPAMLSAFSAPAANTDAPAPGAPRSYPLSKQELRIVHRLANGEPNKVIAHNLNITEATVKVHVKTILRKLGATNRTQAAIWALANGIATLSQPRKASLQ